MNLQVALRSPSQVVQSATHLFDTVMTPDAIPDDTLSERTEDGRYMVV